jgi:hypothetical protein
MKTLIPLITLGFLSPFFIELQSGNIPFPDFFIPGTLFFLITLGYGFAAIIIREISVRYSFGLLSTLILGLAYGIYNEGLIARTLIRDHSMPIEAFNGDGLFLGVNIGFMLIIILAHALQAIVYPILFTNLLFPKVRSVTLLPAKLIMILSVILFIFGTLSFFRTDGFGTGSIISYIFLIGLITLLIISAFVLRHRYHLNISGPWSNKTITLGATALIPFIVVSATAQILNTLSSTILFIVITSILFRFVWMKYLKSEPAWTAFAIGHLISGMLIGGTTILLIHPNPSPILSGYLLVIVFLVYFKLKRLSNRLNNLLSIEKWDAKLR